VLPFEMRICAAASLQMFVVPYLEYRVKTGSEPGQRRPEIICTAIKASISDRG